MFKQTVNFTLAILGVFIILFLINNLNQEEIVGRIKEIQKYGDRYLIVTEKEGIISSVDYFYDSEGNYHDIKVGRNYRMLVVGFRIPEIGLKRFLHDIRYQPPREPVDVLNNIFEEHGYELRF